MLDSDLAQCPSCFHYYTGPVCHNCASHRVEYPSTKPGQFIDEVPMPKAKVKFNKKKMSRKKPITPHSIIRNALRLLYLRSRERAETLKLAGNCCSLCGKKHSRAKGREVTVEVHHLKEPDWNRIFRVIQEELLQSPDRLQAVCETCHDGIHEVGK